MQNTHKQIEEAVDRINEKLFLEMGCELQYMGIEEIIKKELSTIATKSAENERKSWYSPFDGLEIKLMYRDGDKVLQNRHIFSLEQINFIRGISEVVQLKFSYMLKDLLANLPKKEDSNETSK